MKPNVKLKVASLCKISVTIRNLNDLLIGVHLSCLECNLHQSRYLTCLVLNYNPRTMLAYSRNAIPIECVNAKVHAV